MAYNANDYKQIRKEGCLCCSAGKHNGPDIVKMIEHENKKGVRQYIFPIVIATSLLAATIIGGCYHSNKNAPGLRNYEERRLARLIE